MEPHDAAWRSHAVDHVAGALADVPNVADVRGTDSDAGSGAAVGHGSHQLPSEQETHWLLIAPPDDGSIVSALASPVHSRFKRLDRVQVDVTVVAADRIHSPHHRGDANSTAGGGQLGHVLPAVHARVKPLHGAQGGVVIKAAFRRRQTQLFKT